MFALALEFAGGVESGLTFKLNGSWRLYDPYYYLELRAWGWGSFAKFQLWHDYAKLAEAHAEYWWGWGKALGFINQDRYWINQPFLRFLSPSSLGGWAYSSAGLRLEAWKGGLSGMIVAGRLDSGEDVYVAGGRLWPWGDTFAVELFSFGKAWIDTERGGWYANSVVSGFSRLKLLNSALIELQGAFSRTPAYTVNSDEGYVSDWAAGLHAMLWRPRFLWFYGQVYRINPDFRSYLSEDFDTDWDDSNQWWEANRQGCYAELTFKVPAKMINLTGKYHIAYPVARKGSGWQEFEWAYGELYVLFIRGFGIKPFTEYGIKDYEDTSDYVWKATGGWFWVENRMGRVSIGVKRSFYDIWRWHFAWEFSARIFENLYFYARGASVEDHYGARSAIFGQLRYYLRKDRGDITIEYGEGWYSDGLLDEWDLIDNPDYEPVQRFFVKIWLNF